jgi:C-terminal processing protease CtpA/Prc
MDSYDSSGVVKKGLEVISVNGDPMPGIMDKLLSGFLSDGNNKTFKYLEMSKFFSAYYANLIGVTDTFIIGCRDGDQLLELKAAGIDKSQIERYERLSGSNQPYALSFPAERTALLTITSFWMEDDRVGFRKFLKQSFAEINARGIEHLVIDVRNNEGGIDKRGSMLLSYLVDRRFRYYDRLETTTNKNYSFAAHARLPGFYGIIRLLVSKADSGRYVWKHNRNLKTRKPQKQPFKGKVYVLINGASFSVTAEFAAVTHFLKRATFIGEETGGGYYGNNSGTFVIVTLPNSRLNVGIPMLAYYTAVSGYPYRDRGVMPDHEVNPTVNDMLSARDVVLDYTLRMIHQKNGE